MSPTEICHRCPHRQNPCAGSCVCALSGREFTEHVAEGECPDGRFDPANWITEQTPVGQVIGRLERGAPKPPDWTKLPNVQAAFRLAHGAAGFTKATLGIDRPAESVIRRRLAVCGDCPRVIRNKKGSIFQCDACRCFLQKKTALSREMCPEGRWTRSGDSVAVAQLGRYGDILANLPWIRDLAKDQRVSLLVHPCFLPLVEGLGYLTPVPFDGADNDVEGACRLAATLADEVIASQVNGNPLKLKSTSFILDSWMRAGMAQHFHDLPLILDNRDFDAEEELYRLHLRDYRGPLILLNTAGHSSPYEGGDELTKWVAETCGGKVPVIDLAHVRANRIQDLLGLYERATLLISTDTATLHLGHATNTPTVALVNDNPWHASEKRGHWIGRVTYSESRTEGGRSQIAACIEGALAMLPPVQPRILHVVDAWAPEATADRARLLKASQTWHAQVDNWRVLYCHPSRTSETIGDTRQLPFVRDVFDYAVDRAAGDDLIVFTNSDISLVPEASAVIREALRDRPCAYGRRVDVDDDKPRTRADLSRAGTYGGIDLFAFRPAWWRPNRDRFPDLLLACEGWDAAMMLLMWSEHKDAEIWPPIAYHRNHEAFWNRKENLQANAGQLHNRKLARTWAEANGFGFALHPPSHHLIFRRV